LRRWSNAQEGGLADIDERFRDSHIQLMKSLGRAFLVVVLLAKGVPAFSDPSAADAVDVSDRTDCAIFNAMLADWREPPPPPPAPHRRPITFIDPKPRMTEWAINSVNELSQVVHQDAEQRIHLGSRWLRGLTVESLSALKIASRSAREAHYAISCHWSYSRVETLGADWDAELRPSYPAIKPLDFDPFSNCPQSHADGWQPHAAAPSGADCLDALRRSYPRRWFSRPIVTADRRFAVVAIAGSPWPGAGGESVVLLRVVRGRWRYVDTLRSAAG
jgi:hypothetical protein